MHKLFLSDINDLTMESNYLEGEWWPFVAILSYFSYFSIIFSNFSMNYFPFIRYMDYLYFYISNYLNKRVMFRSPCWPPNRLLSFYFYRMANYFFSFIFSSCKIITLGTLLILLFIFYSLFEDWSNKSSLVMFFI